MHFIKFLIEQQPANISSKDLTTWLNKIQRFRGGWYKRTGSRRVQYIHILKATFDDFLQVAESYAPFSVIIINNDDAAGVLKEPIIKNKSTIQWLKRVFNQYQQEAREITETIERLEKLKIKYKIDSIELTRHTNYVRIKYKRRKQVALKRQRESQEEKL